MDKVENAVWFLLPNVTTNRTAYIYIWEIGDWAEVGWDHYYASETGWTPLSPNNYYLQVTNTAVCTGYNSPADKHKIRGQFWVD